MAVAVGVAEAKADVLSWSCPQPAEKYSTLEMQARVIETEDSLDQRP